MPYSFFYFYIDKGSYMILGCVTITNIQSTGIKM